MRSLDGTAGVIAPPPLIALTCLLVGLVLDVRWGLLAILPHADPGIRLFAGGTFVLISLLLFAASVRGFRRAGTPVPTSAPTKALVTTGIHGLSRNPIYLGFAMFHLGLAVILNSWGMLAMFPVLVVVLRFGVIAREEVYLAQLFGDDYENYKFRVPRWL